MARDFTDILSAVWAANALTTIPNPPIPGQAYRNTEIDDSNLENGQQYSEVYDSARYNQLLYLLSGCLKMLMETGIPEWSAEQNYQQNAYTIGSDGKLYGPAKKASGPDNSGAVDPVTDAAGEATTWTLSLPDFEAPLAFDAAEDKVKLSVGNTTTVTGGKLETKIDPNGGLQSSATGVGIKPVASGPVTVDANGVNVSTFTPPTASAPGKAGLVPGPGAGEADKFLRGDGRWVSVNGSMPIGAIYIQTAGTSDPATLFGGTWSNVSSSYAGLFFRAEGGAAAAFGGTQSDGAPNVEGWFSLGVNQSTQFAIDNVVFQNIGIIRAAASDLGLDARKIQMSLARGNNKFGAAAEVRPVNSTIRIWKRTA